MSEPRILLIGNIKEDGSKSMQVYLNYLKKNFHNIDIVSPSTKIRPFFYKNFIYPLKIIKKRFLNNYDIFHIVDHSYGNLAYFLSKDKTIITCHDLIQLKTNIGTWRSRLFFRFYLLGLKRAKKIIADSKNTKKDIIDILNISSEKIKVVPLVSINKNIFTKLDKKVIKQKYELRDEYILLSVGGFAYKNTLLILKTLNKLKKEFPKIRLIKIGDFTEEESKFIKEKNLENLIIKKKNLSEKEIVEMYNLADILVFPSLYEGFGIPPLEAMACGTPVIVSNTSSLPEVVGNAGILINPYSVNELTDAIKKIKNNKNIQKDLIKKGLKNLQRFDKKKIIEKISKIYKTYN